MMKLLAAPNDWLDKVVEPFDFDALDAKQISQDMVSLMQKEGGLGLSANQVGVNGQILVIRPILLEDKTPLTIINPEIVEVSSETEIMVEGCLSYPDLFLHVKRPKQVVVKYLDTSAKECIIELYDIDARCFLHEFDHLNGIKFVDRVSKMKLDRALKKQNKIQKRKING